MFDLDWGAMFTPTQPLFEMFVRGTITYFVLFTVLRFVLKRQTGIIGIADLLVVVLIADAIQNAMVGEYKSITEGVTLLLTIVGWNVGLDWLGHKFPLIERFLRAPPLLLIKDGKMLRRNMRQEMITEEELMSQLRQQGCDRIESVQKAFIEGDGRISIIRKDGQNESNKNSRDKVPI